MARQRRAHHQDFIDYEKFIVGHANFASLPNKFGPKGEIRWVAPSDQARKTWWDKKVKELQVVDRAEVAKLIHPKELGGYKPCQICGEKKSIFYVYPNKLTLAKLNLISQAHNFQPYTEEISEIVSILVDQNPDNAYKQLSVIFKIPAEIPKQKKDFIDYIIRNKKRLSPGAMSNAPDRLDGFHTYNACCRPLHDTGRHASNLMRYTQDRRAYENWAEGNWKLTNRLMGEYGRYKNTAICPNCNKEAKIGPDHIGPISLGFTHRPKFNPLCSSCNSQKNNRMTLADVQQLIHDEESGEEVVSWHSKYIWDKLKNQVSTTKQALVLSYLMRRNLHQVLIILSIISENQHDEFLRQYLHPEYSFKDYKFVNFNPLTGPEEIIETDSRSINNTRNAGRYLRVSFDALKDYQLVENRNSKIWKSEEVDSLMAELLHSLKTGKDSEAKSLLEKILRQLADVAAADYQALLTKRLDEDDLQETLDSDPEA